jgi:hypothetical protein
MDLAVALTSGVYDGQGVNAEVKAVTVGGVTCNLVLLSADMSIILLGQSATNKTTGKAENLYSTNVTTKQVSTAYANCSLEYGSSLVGVSYPPGV